MNSGTRTARSAKLLSRESMVVSIWHADVEKNFATSAAKNGDVNVRRMKMQQWEKEIGEETRSHKDNNKIRIIHLLALYSDKIYINVFIIIKYISWILLIKFNLIR